MDGIPNTPNGASNDAPQPVIVCPACGAHVAAQARFCGACGAEMVAPGVAPAEPATSSPAQPGPAQPAAQPVASVVGEGKTCRWCGAVSAPDARNCSACGATFPTPEGDEALERAARARIEDMQADIQKSHGAPWWRFRSR